MCAAAAPWFFAHRASQPILRLSGTQFFSLAQPVHTAVPRASRPPCGIPSCCRYRYSAATVADAWFRASLLSQPGTQRIVGAMQLYSKEKNVSQPIEGHAAAFHSYTFDGATSPSTLFTFAAKTAAGAKVPSCAGARARDARAPCSHTPQKARTFLRGCSPLYDARDAHGGSSSAPPPCLLTPARTFVTRRAAPRDRGAAGHAP
eukprot:222478-Prymnesium_polylepis.1